MAISLSYITPCRVRVAAGGGPGGRTHSEKPRGFSKCVIIHPFIRPLDCYDVGWQLSSRGRFTTPAEPSLQDGYRFSNGALTNTGHPAPTATCPTRKSGRRPSSKGPFRFLPPRAQPHSCDSRLSHPLAYHCNTWVRVQARAVRSCVGSGARVGVPRRMANLLFNSHCIDARLLSAAGAEGVI